MHSEPPDRPELAQNKAAVAAERPAARAVRFFFGDDIFISYSRRDSDYALALADELTRRKLSCFLDQWGTPAGEELPADLIERLRKASMLVIIGTERAAASENVLKEVLEFKKTRRPIIPITFVDASDYSKIRNNEGTEDLRGTLEAAAWFKKEIAGIARTIESKGRLRPQSPEQGVKPSPHVVNRIVNAEGFLSRSRRLRRIFWTTLALLLGIIAVAGIGSALLIAKANTTRDEALLKAGEAEERSRAAQAEFAKAEEARVKAQEATKAAEDQLKAAQGQLETARNDLRDANQKTLAEQARAAAAQAAAASAQAESQRQQSISANISLSNTAEALRAQQPDMLEVSTLLEVESLRRFRDIGIAPPFSARQTLHAQLSSLAKRVSDFSTGAVVRGVAATRDGKHVATASPDAEGQAVEIWNCAADGCRRTGHAFEAGGTSAVAFSRDEKYLAAASGDRLHVWEWQKPGDVPILTIAGTEGNSFSLSDVAFSNDGRYLGAGGGGVAYVWRWEREKTVAEPLRTFTHPQIAGRLEPSVEGVTFSADGEFMLTACNNVVRAWPTGGEDKPVWEAAPGVRDVMSVAFSPDGRYVASGDAAGVARVWRWEGAKTGQEVFTSMSHDGQGVSSMAFSEDGEFLATGSWGDTAHVWRCGSAPDREVARVVHRDKVWDVALAGRHLLTASEDKTARLSEWRDGQDVVNEMQPDGSPNKEPATILFSPDGSHVAIGECDKIPEGSVAEDGPKNCAVQVWDTVSGRRTGAPLPLQDGYHVGHNSALSPDGRYLVVTRGAEPPQAWDVKTGRVVWQPKRSPWANGDDTAVFSPDGEYLCILYKEADAEGMKFGVWRWEGAGTADGPNTASVLPFDNTDEMLAVSLSRGGKYLATVFADLSVTDYPVANVEVWSTVNGRRVGAPKRHHRVERAITSINPEIPDHSGLIAVAFSPDGGHLSVVSMGIAEVWELDASGGPGDTVLRLSAPEDYYGVGFSTDGRYLRTLSSFGMRVQSRIWRQDDTMAELCGRLSRNLTPSEWRKHFGRELYRRVCGNLPAAEEYEPEKDPDRPRVSPTSAGESGGTQE